MRSHSWLQWIPPLAELIPARIEPTLRQEVCNQGVLEVACNWVRAAARNLLKPLADALTYLAALWSPSAEQESAQMRMISARRLSVIGHKLPCQQPLHTLPRRA